jgi:hypothetical protein
MAFYLWSWCSEEHGIHNPKTRKFSTLLTKTGCSHSGFIEVFDDPLCSYIAYQCSSLNSRHNTVTSLDHRTRRFAARSRPLYDLLAQSHAVACHPKNRFTKPETLNLSLV